MSIHTPHLVLHICVLAFLKYSTLNPLRPRFQKRCGLISKHLENKVVLITGAVGGQRRAAPVLFANEGAKIVGCDMKVEGNIETVEMVRESAYS